MDTSSERGTRGNTATYLNCRCGHSVMILDRGFLDHGPIRCGACGEEVRGAALHRSLPQLLEDALDIERS